jgi:hypothetical protein
MRPGASHAASLAAEAVPARKKIEVSGASTPRDIGYVASASGPSATPQVQGGAQQAAPAQLTPAQRAAQEAAAKRRDVPVRSAE